MSKANTGTFDKALAKSFAPLAANAKLTIQRLGNGIHEIRGDKLAMRIRRGIGHRKDILITLLPIAERPADSNDLSREIGLGVVAEFNGESFPDLPIDTEEDYMGSADYLATAAGRLLFPYLLDTRKDFCELRKFVAARVDEALREIPDYQLPKNVRKEWI